MNNIKRICWVYLATLSFSVQAATWWIELPVQIEGKVVTQLEIETDGMTVEKLDVERVTNAFKGLVSSELLQKISNQEHGDITIEELNSYGIHLNFSPQNLQFDLTLDSGAMAMSSLDFGYDYQVPDYSSSANVTFQNAFNFINRYDFEEKLSENTIEITGALNLFGVYGANLIWNGNIDFSGEGEITESRGPVLLYFDQPQIPMRISMGEMDTSSTNNLSSITITGLSISRSQNTLRPLETTTTAPNQVFELTESADVSILINGRLFNTIKLRPGRYSLDDLPISSGANDISLVINYLSGKQEIKEFSNFYSAAPLAKGFDDFNLSTGIVSDYSSDGLKATYQETWIASGLYRYGLTDGITLGAISTYHPDAQIVGLDLVFTSSLGTLSLRPSINLLSESINDNLALKGFAGGDESLALSVDYSQTFFATTTFTGTDIRLNANFLQNYSAQPWFLNSDQFDTSNTYIVSIGQGITEQLSLDLSGQYQELYFYNDTYNGKALLSFQWDSLTAKTGIEYYSDSENFTAETRYIFNVTWSGMISDSSIYGSLSYDQRGNYTRAELSSDSAKYVGDLDGSVSYTYVDNNSSASVESNYIANRFRGRMNYNYKLNQDKESSSSLTSNISTTFAFVDGRVSLSPQPIGALAMVDVHDSLTADVLINPSRDEYEGVASRYLSTHTALSSHITSRVIIESPDAQVGYNLGSGSYNVTPGSLTGHILEVGSDFSNTVIGQFIDQDSKPIALKVGKAYQGDHSVSFFTNSNGRFALEGVSTGIYNVEVSFDGQVFKGKLDIQPESNLLYRAGTVILQRTQAP
ncbi:hypothetical protein [Vibrio algicola]|uniref:Fimbrial biogenesis outer membrane usher protein n=1 Tax=Vibrio algicola TaxID=2662262 RepID=A0A5Q0THJ6_9VIBR|nr:hypothetical protein [Vibrio algicola]